MESGIWEIIDLYIIYGTIIYLYNVYNLYMICILPIYIYIFFVSSHNCYDFHDFQCLVACQVASSASEAKVEADVKADDAQADGDGPDSGGLMHGDFPVNDWIKIEILVDGI